MSIEPLTGGIDEVGWGALAGPIISVVAVFRDKDLALLPPGVKDSKKLTEIGRKNLFLPLCAAAYDVGIGHAWPWEIDTLGPYPCLQLSYTRALADLNCVPAVLYVDGKNQVRTWKGVQIIEPKADQTYKQVSAASIIAKHFRDTIMVDYAKELLATTGLDYDWKNNKGYGSASHGDAIHKNGLLINPNNLKMYYHRKAYCEKYL